METNNTANSVGNGKVCVPARDTVWPPDWLQSPGGSGGPCAGQVTIPQKPSVAGESGGPCAAPIAPAAYPPVATLPAVLLPHLELPASDTIPPRKPARRVVRCKRCHCAEYIDVPIHDGQSIRRDCARCGRLIDFPVWYGQSDGVPV